MLVVTARVPYTLLRSQIMCLYDWNPLFHVAFTGIYLVMHLALR